VATVAVIGVAREADLFQKVGNVAEASERWGVPQLTEMIPAEILGHQLRDRAQRKWPADPTEVAFAARAAAEVGADIVKGYYTGDPNTFRGVIEYCPVPYVILSGPAASNPEEFLGFVREAIRCGAAGVSVGRNVWTHRDPEGMTRAICRIVHAEATVAQAMADL
jgi:fructose-bisphosphate aldolase/2-amino-3,7-dideoxy-D-threo-hept-6-ulosonate synthase